jgi:hypothetical protein
MKCRQCGAQNLREANTCWACGIQLMRKQGFRDRRAFRPEAMRHYSAGTAALTTHRTWLDGIVLVCTILFGLLLGSFAADVLPGGNPAGRITAMLDNTPLSFLTAPSRTLALQPMGAAQEVNGVVVQVASSRRSAAEAGRDAPAGTQLLTATVVIDNQGKQALPYALADWKVRDSRGRVIQAQAINSAGWLSSGRVAPGQQVQGSVTFAIPEGDASPQVTFSPRALGSLFRWDASQR